MSEIVVAADGRRLMMRCKSPSSSSGRHEPAGATNTGDTRRYDSAGQPPPEQRVLPELEPKPPIETSVNVDALAALRDNHPEALGAPRQQARFLAGITSPATSRAKLTKDAVFGSLAERRFAEILAWCEARGE